MGRAVEIEHAVPTTVDSHRNRNVGTYIKWFEQPLEESMEVYDEVITGLKDALPGEVVIGHGLLLARLILCQVQPRPHDPLADHIAAGWSRTDAQLQRRGLLVAPRHPPHVGLKVPLDDKALATDNQE